MLKKVSVIAEDFVLNAEALSEGEMAMISLIDVVEGEEKDVIEMVVSPDELREMIGAMTYILESIL